LLTPPAPLEENEERLHQAVCHQARQTFPPQFDNFGAAPFRTFFMGGFECSPHQRRDGERLDLIAATRHDKYCAADYAQLATLGIRTVRDGLRWHKIEAVPGRYDWSSFLPMLRAARDTGTQVIWSLAHWGWPQHLDIWSPAFVDRFAEFSRAAARIVREETDTIPLYLPVNEISFWSWAGGSVGYIAPFGIGRGSELKTILVRASIASIEAVRSVDARSRIVAAEPAIHIAAKSDSPEASEAARAHTNGNFGGESENREGKASPSSR
jgi:beta-glucosidase/6-phospho-beta-glucosidase/beta-galactosidase